MATKPIILDGTFTDWDSSEIITTPANAVPGYSLYGTVQNDTYFIGIQATVGTDPVIGAGTTIWLNTDQNTATGYSPFDSIGADYYVNYFAGDAFNPAGFYLYTGAGVFLTGPLTTATSKDGESLEIAIPRIDLTPAGGTAPTNINIAAEIGGGPAIIFAPSDYNLPEYTITDPATLLPKTVTHKVAIVYSDTTAKLYFRGLGDAAGAPSTAYDDLIMAAQNQARMAGVSYDVIDESQLTDINNLIGYDALIFPSMADVNTAQLPAIMSTLTSAVYNYHIGIITSGDFLTNDENGNPPLTGNAYANMQALLGLSRVDGGSGDITVTAADIKNPIMDGYTAGQIIQSYTGQSYNTYQAVGTTPSDVLVNQVVNNVAHAGVIETTTGGTNVHFASQALLGDSNLLSNAIQTVVLGTTAGVALHTSRDAGIVAVRMDMDQAQVPADVSPPVLDASGNPTGATLPGIYDTLIPILTQWKAQYDFVGSYYVDIGDNPTPANPTTTDPTTTDWAKSLPYYQQILALGGEIGTHSYTHLINPPITTFTAHTVGATGAGATTITLDQVPSFYGITVGMWLTGTGIGSNTQLPGSAGEGGAVANTQVIGVDNVNKTITISYVPAGFGGTNQGTIGAISAGTTLTFSVPPENTNFLEPVTGTNLSSDGKPFTFAYEFGTSTATLEQELSRQLGHPVTIYGAAVPGAAETAATSQNILTLFPSGTGYTGYVTGGWTGIDSGYPSAFGYIDPTHQTSVYIAPNMTFDFTEVQYQGKSVVQAEADWMAQFKALTSNAAGTPVVVLPIHDYGAAAWNTTTDSATGSPYAPVTVTNPDGTSTVVNMYADFLANAYANNYEFVTLEDLASRIAAQEKAHIDYTASGNTITTTVTPDASAPDLGAMALDVVNGGSQVIQSVTNWYAYNSQELFLPRNGGSFTINLGATQADVTHIAALPMRGDLLSVTGDGSNLSFSMVGDGNVLVDLAGTATPLVTGATIVSQVGDQLTLGLTGLGQHDVTILLLAHVTSVAFSPDTGASATDFITNVAAQTISGNLSGPLGAGDVVKVSLDNGATWLTATAAAGGTTFSLKTVLPAGSNTLVARVENSAHAFSTPLSQAYMLDQTKPLAPAALRVDATTDSGVLSTDGITNVTMPLIDGTAEAGSTVTLYDGTTVIGTGVAAASGSWSIKSTAILPNGVQSITATATDVAGNTGPASTVLPVTIDTVVPTPAPSQPQLDPASDSGLGNNITNTTTPIFDGTANANTLVTLFDGAAVIGTGTSAADGTWKITSSTLAAGAHRITAEISDAAGNYSKASGQLTVSVQASGASPSTPLLTAATDTGASKSDGITNIALPAFTGTAPLSNTVTVYLNGTTVIGTVKANATTGKWTVTETTTLADGTYSITATATTPAGVVSAPSLPMTLVIDTKVPAVPPAPTLLDGSDSGVKGDNITNSTTPTFTGAGAEAGSTVTLFNGTANIGTAVAAADGSWAIASKTALANGAHSITITDTDLAGNVSVASAALALTIDTTAPARPALPDLVATSDSGVSSTDNITKVTTPSLAGTAAALSTVTVYDGTTVLGTASATALGTWSLTPTLQDGKHSITVKAVDAAGNVSAASSALALTIDTVAPNDPTVTGGSATTLTGAGEAGATVAVFNGTTSLATGTVGSAGNWNLSFVAGTSPLSLSVVLTDKAGNVDPGKAVLVGTANADALAVNTPNEAAIGGAGADKFTVTAASVFLAGGGGADTFSFSALSGSDIISDFAAGAAAGHDVINIHGSSVLNSFANVLTQTTQVGTGVVISDGTNTLTLNNVTKTNLTAADFSFA